MPLCAMIFQFAEGRLLDLKWHFTTLSLIAFASRAKNQNCSFSVLVFIPLQSSLALYFNLWNVIVMCEFVVLGLTVMDIPMISCIHISLVYSIWFCSFLWVQSHSSINFPLTRPIPASETLDCDLAWCHLFFKIFCLTTEYEKQLFIVIWIELESGLTEIVLDHHCNVMDDMWWLL